MTGPTAEHKHFDENSPDAFSARALAAAVAAAGGELRVHLPADDGMHDVVLNWERTGDELVLRSGAPSRP